MSVKPPKKTIKYALGGITAPGAREPWRENPDNPASPNFTPLTARSERAKARWWAFRMKRQNKLSHGVYDA